MGEAATSHQRAGAHVLPMEARDLVMQFSGLRAVDRMSLSLKRGELLGLIGPNGAGKTTFFNLVAGTLKPTSGTIAIEGQDATNDGPDRRIAQGLGRTFQIPKPFAEMTVLENVLTGAQNQAGEGILANFLRGRHVGHQEKMAVDKARGLLDFLTLSHLEHERARVLSGGQRKLLELARILMADPSTILLDEPAAGVNPTLLEFIVDRIIDLNRRGTSILLIEHNMDMVARLCDRVVVMAAGRFLMEGTPDVIARDPAVIEAYLGGMT